SARFLTNSPHRGPRSVFRKEKRPVFRRGVSGFRASGSGGGLFLAGSEAAIEGFALRGHIAQQLVRREARPVFLGELVAFLDESSRADHVDQRERTTCPGREAPAK